MENNTEILSAINDLLEVNRRQQSLLEKQTRVIRILGVLFACLVLSAVIFLVTLLPRLSKTIDELNAVALNSQQITQELSQADLDGVINSLTDTLNSVQDLVDANSDTVAESLKKLETLDIDTLNQAIDSLYQVVNPLARLFGH